MNRRLASFMLLLLGGLLTTVAFFGAFFWAGVPDFGLLELPEKADSVRYQGTNDVPLATAEYAANFVGFQATIEKKDGDVITGKIVEGDSESITIDTDDGGATVRIADIEQFAPLRHVYGRPDWGQKIFYFHVPVAEASFLVFMVGAIFGGMFLAKRKEEYDTRARIAMEVALVFVMMTMVTGIFWTKAAWGVWWEWEPRLTTYFIMTLLLVGYFVLRNSVEDPERRAVYAAGFGILAFIDAPISFAITRLIPSNHPVIERGGLEPPMLITFIIAQIGMLMLGYAIYSLRRDEESLRVRIEAAKDALEE